MDRLCEIKEKLIDVMYDVITNNDIENICSKELYEVMDIIKDIEETKYYKTITDSMEKSDEDMKHIEKYIPEYKSRMYYNNDSEKITLDSIMDDIDKLMSELSDDEKIKHKQKLIGYLK